MRAWGLAAFSLGVFAACGGDDGGNTPIDAPPAQVDASVDANIPVRTIFLNKNGGTYTMGPNDAVANTQGYSTMPVNVPAYPGTEQEWNTTRDCVAQLFAPFGVNVVDVDPGAVDHVEVVMTTSSTVFGLANNIISIAPSDPSCALLERALVASFVYTSAAQTRLICEQTAAIVGIAYGLDWATTCPDLMSWSSGCGDKEFRDVDAMCGETAARACRCGGTTQNSHRFLAGRLGLR